MGKNYTRKKTKYKNIIKNLKLEDKLIHLFKLFFDEQLIKTICRNKILISIENNNLILQKQIKRVGKMI